MNNRVFDLILLVPMAMIIVCLVFLISMLIRHEVPKKMCIFLYKICKTNNKKTNISVKKVASKEVKQIKKDMKLCKDVLAGKKENKDALVNKKTEIKTTDNENNKNKDLDKSIEKIQDKIKEDVDKIITNENEKQVEDDKNKEKEVTKEENINKEKIQDDKDDNKNNEGVLDTNIDNEFEYLCNEIYIQTDDRIE